MSNAIDEFSRFAHQYKQHNVIQTEVAKRLVSTLKQKNYHTILDIGCGSGAVYENMIHEGIGFQHFKALDSAQEMLAIHPSHTTIEKICADFNTVECYAHIQTDKETTLLCSASALQWSQNLDFVFSQLSKKAQKTHMAIFTSGTFRTLHKTANIMSPIYTKAQLQEVISKYYDASFQLESYRLDFPTVRDMFRYIKKSGVSGGEKQLSYIALKQLMQDYPLKYLEFEVLFVTGTSLS